MIFNELKIGDCFELVHPEEKTTGKFIKIELQQYDSKWYAAVDDFGCLIDTNYIGYNSEVKLWHAPPPPRPTVSISREISEEDEQKKRRQREEDDEFWRRRMRDDGGYCPG